MIDEITLIKEMLGDLTGVGIWGFVAYLSYGLIKFLSAWGIALYILNRLITEGFDYIKCPVTKDEYARVVQAKDRLSSEITGNHASHAAKVTALDSELERVKHMYKILKEAQEHKEDISNE